MHTLSRRALAAALVLAAAARAQTNATRDARPAGTVAGRVTTGDGKPVPNFSVALMPAEMGFDRKPIARGATDADGRYKCTNVPAGRYRLQTAASVYSSPDERTGSPFDKGKSVTVGAGEAVENFDITVVRGGVITGRVTNSEGKPVIAERVTVAYADRAGERGPVAWAVSPFEFETDDRGVYRVYGVPPGRYLISVGQARDSGSITVGPTGAQYARTFHPSATEAAQAKIVEVSAGGETTNVDISLADAPKAYQARGRIVDDSGKPLAGVGYGFGSVRGDARTVGAWGTDGQLTNSDGEFVLKNLMPGRYAAFAVSDFGATPLEVYSDAVQFEVTDADVSGLVVKVHRGASLSGTVVVEGTTDRAVLAGVTQVRLYASTAAPQVGGSGAAADIAAPNFAQVKVNADGTFRVAGLRPGKVRVNVQSFGAARRFTLLGVQRGGADAAAGVDVGEGEQVTGVRVRLGYGTGVVRGQIDLRDGSQPAVLPGGARLIVSARRAGDRSAQQIPVEVDSRGRFTIDSLLGGDYEINVNAFVPRPPGAPQPPPRRIPSVRQIISVTDGSETTVTITFDLSRPAEPNP